MPTRFPTYEDISLPNIGAARPVAGIDVSAYGAGTQALAQGFQNLGTGIEKAGQDLAQLQTYRARNDALLAQDKALGDAIQLRQDYRPGGPKYNADPDVMLPSYKADLDSIAQKHLGTIPEGPLREHAMARIQIPFAHEFASVSDQARRKQINDFRSGLIDEADHLINTVGPTDDPMHTGQWVQWGTKVQQGREKGFLTPMEAETLMRKTARGIMDGEFKARFRAGRESAAKAVRDLIIAQGGVVEPTVAAWRNAGMTDKGIAGVLHNIKEESGFDPTLRHFDQPRYAARHPEDPEGAFAHGLYQEGADEWNRYRRWLAGRGEAADWRDPQLQSEFAAWNLKTNYPATWQKMANAGTAEQAAAIYASEYLKPAAQYLNSRLQKIDQGVAPLEAYKVQEAKDAQAQTVNSAREILEPGHRDKLIREGRSILHAYDVDDANALKEQEAQRKYVSDQKESEIMGKIMLNPMNPGVSMQDIIDLGPNGNGILGREAFERTMKLYDSKVGKTGEDKHGPGFWDAYQRVHAMEGDPSSINDPEQIYRMAAPGGALTLQDAKELATELHAKNGSGAHDEAESELRKQFLTWAKHEVSGEHGLMKMKDPKGEEIFAKFLGYFWPEYRKGIQAGKSPQELLDTEKGELAKALKGMKRPMSVWMNDVINDSPEAGGGASPTAAKPAASAPMKFEPAAVKSVDDLVGAFRAGQIDKATFAKLAIERGWARPDPAPAQTTIVPGSPSQGAVPAVPLSLPENARQAPDGNHYVPDPDRPGKYLQVVPR